MYTTHNHKDAADAKEHVKSAARHLEEGGHRVRKEVRDTADNVQGDISSMAHNVGEQARDFLDSASDNVVTAKKAVMDASDTVAKQVKGNPLTAVVVAAAAGVLLGAFLRRSA